MKEITYDVPGVSCNHCVNAITRVAQEAGVNEVDVNLVTKKVFVSFDPAKVDEVAFKASIVDEGYDITGETPGRAGSNSGSGKKTLHIV